MNNTPRLKVLHVTYNDVSGGAARYVMRLHESLLRFNVDSLVLVMNKESDSKTVIEIKKSFFKNFSSVIDKIPSSIFNIKSKNKFSSGMFNDFISSEINKISPDIVHLHWINNGMISIKSLKKIKYPLFWSVLDMWPFSGGSHYNYNDINSSFLSKYLLKLKTQVYSKINFTPIAISQWIKDEIIKSGTMHGKDIKIVYPSLNLNQYKPIDKYFSRKLFNLPKIKNLILFGAMNSTKDLRKGFDILISALKLIDDNDFISTTEIVVFGSSNADFALDLKFKVNFLGKLKSDYGIYDGSSLSALYSCANITIAPSIQEAFGQVAIESLACGVPVIAFDNTGLTDIITHKHDGFLCKNGDIEDLSKGIVWGVKNSNKMFNNCVNKARKLFNDEVTSLQLIKMYKNKIKN
jgi:glycosyltransferase involved in cell wall biosynthesis